MNGYSTQEVAELLGLSSARVRRLARSASLNPDRAPRGWYRFDFRDLVLIRTALALEREGITPLKVHRSLRKLKQQLPEGRPLTAIRISSEAEGLVVRDGRLAWNPESGQVQLELADSERGRNVASLDRRRARAVDVADRRLAAEDWYEFGCALQASSEQQAGEAFSRAVELDPGHSDAHVNLGFLLHQAGDLEGAEMRYRLALRANPKNSTAAFNLGVVLEDEGRRDEALAAYHEALQANPKLADAYYNLSRIYEQTGDRATALRHLRSYSELVAIS
jgi:tetratricopeptide (TPR) repeat protein